MRTLAEVLALQDTDQKICYLKKARKTDLSDAVKLHNDWNPNKHEIITDEEKYPKIKVTVGTEPVLDCKPEQSEEAQIKLTNATFSAKFFVLVLYLVPLSINQNAMGSKEKLIERFKKQPKDFTFEETLSLLGYFGYVKHNKGATSGSRIRFKNEETGQYIDIYRPHPGSIMKAWMMKAIYQHLKNNGLI